MNNNEINKNRNASIQQLWRRHFVSFTKDFSQETIKLYQMLLYRMLTHLIIYMLYLIITFCVQMQQLVT